MYKTRKACLAESYSGYKKKSSPRTALVPRIGLEPTCLAALAPETSASTISPSGQYSKHKNSIFFRKLVYLCQFICIFTYSITTINSWYRAYNIDYYGFK